MVEDYQWLCLFSLCDDQRTLGSIGRVHPERTRLWEVELGFVSLDRICSDGNTFNFGVFMRSDWNTSLRNILQNLEVKLGNRGVDYNCLAAVDFVLEEVSDILLNFSAILLSRVGVVWIELTLAH